MYRRQRSKPFRLPGSPNIITEFFYAVVDRNLPVCQKGLKCELRHFSEATGLPERQSLLPEER